MIRIAITVAAFDAVSTTLPLGSERETGEKGRRLIWVERQVAYRFAAMRQPGESMSNVIIRLAAAT